MRGGVVTCLGHFLLLKFTLLKSLNKLYLNLYLQIHTAHQGPDNMWGGNHMKSVEIAKEVEALQKEKSAIVEKLNTLIRGFQSELPPVAEKWIRREVERQIEDHPDVVEKLGVDKLKVLKGKVTNLIASIPEIVKDETSNESDWPHNRAVGSTGYGAGRNEPFFDKSFRNVISYLGGLLEEFDLLSQPKGYITIWQRVGGGKFRFGANPGFEGTPSTKEFDEIYKQFKTLSESVDRKQDELARAKARELWESA
jgi:hypothetical protein